MPSPIRRNSAYQDPSIAKAFDNLATAFAPPSGTDVYGFARAGAETEKAKRLAEMFAYAKDPTYTREMADRLGVMGGLYNPNQSYYSVDQGNATTVRTTGMNNATTIKKTQMDNDAALARQFALPVHAKQDETVYLPDQTTKATGLPAMFRGNISTNPGETVTTPGGGVYQGQPKPLNESEQTAAIIAALPPQEQRAFALRGAPVDVVMGPDNRPVNAFRPDTVGKQPVLSEDKAPKPQLANYKLPGEKGLAGTAIYDPAVGWRDTQTGQPLPAGAQTYTANLTGDKAGTGLGPTTANNTAANNRAAEVTRTLNTLDLYENLINKKPGSIGIPGLIRGTAQNSIQVMQDMANSFGKSVPQIQEATAELQKGLQNVAPEYFDKAIPEAQFYQGTLAYALARTENPSGEVSRQAFDRALTRVKGGLLANSAEARANLGAFRKVLKTELAGIGTLRDPTTARTDTGLRTPDVKRLKYNPATGQLE